MARLLRTQPPQPRYSSQELPPPTPPFAPISVNLATGLLTDQRRAQQRRVNQGWGSQQQIETGSAGTLTFGAAWKLILGSAQSLDASNQQQLASLMVPAVDATVTSLRITARSSGSPTDNLIVEIQTDSAGFPSGVALTSTVIPAASLTTTMAFYDFAVSCALSAGTRYWVVFRRDGAPSASPTYQFNLFFVIPSLTLSARNNGTVWSSGSAILPYYAVTTAGDNLGVRVPQLGPRPPVFIDPAATPPPPPVVSTLSINLATGLLTAQRRAQQRRVLGWREVSKRDQDTVVSSPDGVGFGFSESFGRLTFPVSQARQFIPEQDGSLLLVRVPLSLEGTPTDSVVLQIQSDSGGTNLPSGTVLAQADIPASVLTTSLQVIEFGISLPLVAGTKYWVVLSRSGALDNANCYDTYDATRGGFQARSAQFGSSWTASTASNSQRAASFVFRVPGVAGSLPYIERFIGPKPPQAVTFAPNVPTEVFSASGLLTNQRRAQQRRTTSDLRPPILATTTFVASPAAVYTATGLLTNQRRNQQRISAYRLGSPVAVNYPAAVVQTLDIHTVDSTRPRTRRRIIARLAGPVVVQPVVAAPVETTVAVTLAPRRAPRHALSVLPTTIVAAATFIAPPVSVNCLQPDRLAHRLRRMPSQVSLNPPTALQLFFGPSVKLQAVQRVQAGYQRRGPLPISRLSAPATLEPAAIQLAERRIRVELVRTLPRPTAVTLGQPTTLQVFAGPSVTFAAARRGRRKTVFALYPPTVVTTAVFVAAPIVTELVARDTRISMRRRFPLQGWDGDSAAGPTVPGRYPNMILAARPTSYWRLGEAAGAATAVDQIGGNDGTYGGTVALGQPGLVTGDPETAAAFGAANANVAVPTPLLTGQTEWTFECLYRAPFAGTTRVLYEEAGTNDLVSIRNSAGTLALNYRDDAGVLNSVALGSGLFRIDDGGLHHIVVTRQGTTVQGTVDGTKVSTNTIGSGAQTETVTATIGRTASGPNGAMQEVAIYRRKLGSGEVLQHYLAAVAGASGQVVYLRRNLGPKPPLIVADVPLALESLTVKTVAVTRRNTETRRRAHWLLAGPTTYAQPPPVAALAVYYLTPDRAVARRVRLRPALRPPTVLAVFAAGKSTLVQTRPRPTVAFVSPPATLEPFSVELAEETVRVELVHTRPRRTRAVLQPPTVVRVPAVEQNEQTIRVTLVSLRAAQRRRTTHSLTAVTYPQTTEIVTVLTRTRPRPTSTSLTAVSYPATSEITVAIVRTRPRPTTTILAGPVVLQTFAAGVPALTTTRPRPTDRFLAPPATLEPESIQLAEETVRVTLARIRPRHTEAVLAEPTVVRVPSVEQREQTISVTLVRARPRRTTTSIGKGIVQSFPPVVTTIAVSATLVRNRPRHTIHALTPPTVVRVPSVEQQEDTIRVAVVRVRPRPTRKPLLEQPTVLQVFTAPVAPFVRTRPRPTRSHLTYVVYPATSEIAVTVVHTRPRPTSRFLSEPTTLQTFSGPTVTVVQTRPRPTTAYVAPPATLEPESVQLAEETIRVHLAPSRRGRPTTRLTYVTYPATSEITVAVVRTRPRPTVHSLTAVSYPATSEILVALTRTRPRPTTASLTAVSYPASSDITVTLTRTRPRPTTRLLGEPTVLQVFAAGRPALAQTRPRPTTTLLAPPTVVRVPSVEQQEDTIRVTVVHTRPRPTHVFLREPLVKTFPPVVTTLTILTVAVRRPLEQRRHVVEHFLRAPQVVIPLPTLRMQTITVATVRTRPRPTLALLQPPTRLQVFAAAKTPLVHTRPRPTTRFLGEPTVVRIPAVDQRLRTIRVELVRVRPRHTVAFVAPPATLEPESVQLAEREIRVELVRTRPRRTAADVFAPTVLQTFAGPTVHLAPARRPVTASQILPLPPTRPERVTVETDLRVNLVARRIDAKTHATVFPPTVLEPTVTEITVALVQARPRPTVSTLTFVAPRAAVETKIKVALTRIRPRPTEVAVTTPAATARQPVATTIRVELVRTRPKATTATLQPPTRLRPPETTVRTHLVRRPTPAVQATLSSPTAVAVFTAKVDVTVTRTRPRATTAFLSPPTVVTPIRPPEVTDITVVLVALEQRLLHRPVRHFKITAAVVRRHGRAGRSEGSTVPASASEGGSIGSTGSEGGTQPSGASSGESSAQHRATIRDVPSARSEGEDRS